MKSERAMSDADDGLVLAGEPCSFTTGVNEAERKISRAPGEALVAGGIGDMTILVTNGCTLDTRVGGLLTRPTTTTPVLSSVTASGTVTGVVTTCES